MIRRILTSALLSISLTQAPAFAGNCDCDCDHCECDCENCECENCDCEHCEHG